VNLRIKELIQTIADFVPKFEIYVYDPFKGEEKELWYNQSSHYLASGEEFGE